MASAGVAAADPSDRDVGKTDADVEVPRRKVGWGIWAGTAAERERYGNSI